MMKVTNRLILALVALPMTASVLLAAEGAEGAEGAAEQVHSKTLMEYFHEGGWVMYFLLACSVLTFYLIWEGMNRTAAKKWAPAAHEEDAKNFFLAGDYAGSYDSAKSNPSPLNNVLRTGVSLLGEGKSMAEEGMFSEMAKEYASVQNFISYLSVVGVCTPMIGLVGTVSGMMKAFETMGSAGIGDPSKLSGAIGEVLVATLCGLAIAIPAFGMFYVLRNRLANAQHHVQDVTTSLFRKMPWEQLAGAHIGDEPIYANTPAWLAGDAPAAH
jgi:biopolymer transport protein ExbB